MNSLLRYVGRRIRYRPFPQIVGHVVTVPSLATVINEVQRKATELLPGLQLEKVGENITALSLAKYGIIDLRFQVSGVVWKPSDAPGISVLREFGFVMHPAEISDELELATCQDGDSTCLGELQKEIAKNQDFLCLFVEEQPSRNLQEHALSIAKGGGLSADFVDRFLSAYFPKDLVVIDACLTNAPFIWFYRHFYL